MIGPPKISGVSGAPGFASACNGFAMSCKVPADLPMLLRRNLSNVH
jgi:hypothetical protein